MSCNFNVAHFPKKSEIRYAFPKAKLSVLTQRFQDCPMDAEEEEESLQLEFIEMRCENYLRNQHQLLSITDFYRSLEKAKFPLMRIHTKRMMSLFNKLLFSNIFA